MLSYFISCCLSLDGRVVNMAVYTKHVIKAKQGKGNPVGMVPTLPASSLISLVGLAGTYKLGQSVKLSDAFATRNRFSSTLDIPRLNMMDFERDVMSLVDTSLLEWVNKKARKGEEVCGICICVLVT